MPIRQTSEPAELVIEHNGVKVYRCYTEDMVECPEKFIFTLNPTHTDASGMVAFDVRELEVPSATLVTTGGPPIRHNLQFGTAEYHQSVAAWTEWWDVTEAKTIKTALVEAIDAGILTP